LADLKFQLDEHMHHGVAVGLRQLGRDVVTSADAGLLAAPDIVQLEHARANGRVMVTQDKDFLRLHRQGVSHRGIAYSAHGTRSIRQIIEALMLLDEVYDPDEMVGRLEYL
jgi:predicted nuclease of predicted toxin-antitoxin system